MQRLISTTSRTYLLRSTTTVCKLQNGEASPAQSRRTSGGHLLRIRNSRSASSRCSDEIVRILDLFTELKRSWKCSWTRSWKRAGSSMRYYRDRLLDFP